MKFQHHVFKDIILNPSNEQLSTRASLIQAIWLHMQQPRFPVFCPIYPVLGLVICDHQSYILKHDITHYKDTRQLNSPGVALVPEHLSQLCSQTSSTGMVLLCLWSSLPFLASTFLPSPAKEFRPFGDFLTVSVFICTRPIIIVYVYSVNANFKATDT